jgi:fructokinase
MMNQPLAIGIDVGGSKLEAIALDASGRELWRRRVPTPRGDYDASTSARIAAIEAS